MEQRHRNKNKSLESIAGSEQDEKYLEQQNEILQQIMKKVQLGGDACLKRFNSFGPDAASESSQSGYDQS